MLMALPAAAGLIGDVGGLLKSAENFINPGAVRDANRLARAQWMQQAAVMGSETAARIIIAAPKNVAGDEQHYWADAANAVQTGNPAVWARAVRDGGTWPTGAPFDMPAQRTQIMAEIGGATVPGSIPTTGGPVGEVVTVTPGPATQTAAKTAANSAGYQLVPTTILWLAVGAGVLYLVLRRKA